MIINSYVLFYVLFLQIEAPSPLQSKEPKQSKQTSAYACMHIHALPPPPPPPPPPQHTHMQSIGQLEEVRFQIWFQRCVFDDLTRETVPDRRCSARKRSLTKRVSAHEGKTKNGSIRRRAQLAGWFVNFQEFSQVDRSSRVEAVTAQRTK